MVGYLVPCIVLNCTWDDMEAETALRKLGVQSDEQQRAEQFYLKLREDFKKKRPAAVPAPQAKAQ
ncbi:MAG: hypothetical protein M3N93_12850 [Acidobacteriota bacterium]|nr:hypothetical protein [Acidobacteriota bacterium]